MNGEVMVALSQCIPLPNSVRLVEALVARSAFQFALHVGIEKSILGGDF